MDARLTVGGTTHIAELGRELLATDSAFFLPVCTDAAH